MKIFGKTRESTGSNVTSNIMNTARQSKSSRAFFRYFLLGVVAFSSVLVFNPFYRSCPKAATEVPNVHFIDSVGPNLLFRGALPLTGEPPVLNYDGLKQAISRAGKEAGVEVPSAYYMIDVNFLNIENPTDAERISAEQEFFQDHPALGRIQVWGMNGTGLSANDAQLAASREYLGSHLEQWLCDKLASRVEILRGWLEGSSPIPEAGGKPVVIYIHCVAGCDRTGEFSGAYYLRYLHRSWEEVNRLNQSFCPHQRPFGCKNYRAVQWYCMWLNLRRGFRLNWFKEFQCSGR